jgi:hypothetical protein
MNVRVPVYLIGRSGRQTEWIFGFLKRSLGGMLTPEF